MSNITIIDKISERQNRMEEKYFKKSGGVNSEIPRAPRPFMSEQQHNSEISNETQGGIGNGT